MQSNNHAERSDERYIIEQTLLDLGVPPHLNGFFYLHDAIGIALAVGGKVRNMVIYAALAEQYHVSKSIIERSMRHAVRVTFERSISSLQTEWFGSFVDLRYDRPTNSVFIAVVAAQPRHRLAEVGRQSAMPDGQPKAS